MRPRTHEIRLMQSWSKMLSRRSCPSLWRGKRPNHQPSLPPLILDTCRRAAQPLSRSQAESIRAPLALSERRRLRNKEHLRFFAQQPCLLCGRKPSDPHHLRFTQPRALGRKASDEFAVPLCRIHHKRLIGLAMNVHGGWLLALIRSRSRASCGKTRVHPKTSLAQMAHCKPLQS